MSDTPRTDALIGTFYLCCDACPDSQKCERMQSIHPDDARQFEREFAEARGVEPCCGDYAKCERRCLPLIWNLRARLARQWILVSERLPETPDTVFVRYSDTEFGIDSYEDEGWTAYDNGLEEYRAVACDGMVFGMKPPTHWMPIPQ